MKGLDKVDLGVVTSNIRNLLGTCGEDRVGLCCALLITSAVHLVVDDPEITDETACEYLKMVLEMARPAVFAQIAVKKEGA